MSSFLLRRSFPSSTAAARAFSSTSAARAGTLARMTIVGRLADQPEVLATSTGGDPIVKYAVGTNSGPKDNQKTSWFKVTAFLPEGPRRDYIAGLEKGSLVYVEGDATMSQYTDSEGKNRTSLNIVQQKLEVLARKRAPEEQQ